MSNAKQASKNSDIIPNKQATQDILEMKISTPKEAKNTHILRYELQKALKPIIAKPITNKNDGRVAILNKDGHKKIQSTKAISKSIENGFSEKQHFEVAKCLKELYENARLREITPDKNADKNIQIPRYEAHFMLDGQPAQAKITLKETMKGKYKGNRIYTIELESIAKLPSEP
ncbi:LPD3 domain-containing protein [Helicobacter sp. T3_23-1056]